ncbi:hypothetical protein CPB84DRAFT_1746402 [Gymnopilus junonius]|uniref:Uncharacterized protein n=1 Tax=Gymnopilus junonius TaxID=109634 RepID=A0A9P5TPB1_GYMJU|nr:hypothetical protein CPB84DRAFT_1746402 [Gymnopilus junonius]
MAAHYKNMPALWRELPPFHLGSSDKNELKRRIECLSTLLVRSFPEKLTFFLSKKETPRTDDKILFMLFKHSERWERISLVISEDVCAQFSRVKGHISSLRSLKLFISRTGRLHVDMFEVAPKLEEVYLSSTPWAGSMRLPWHQLGCFTEESTENNHLHYILKEARELKNLDITFHKDSFDGFDAIPHVTFRQLTTLVVQCFAAWQFYINPLFDKLTLPALQELVFRGHCPTSYVSSLALMIRRSACTLQKLTLHNYCILASELESILLLTPSLSHLAIANPTIEVLELFQRDEQAPVHQWTLVPHLQSLTACLDDESSDLNALKHFARPRCDLIFHSVSCAIHGRPTELETFRIIPSTRHDFLNYAEHFGSPATKFDILKSATSYNIAVTNNTIDVHIRKIQLTNTDPEMSRKSRSNAVSREVGNVISLLEHLEITPEMVVYLYLKRVKHRISQLLLDVQMPTDSKINFSRRLDALLPLWTSVLNQVSSELRWGWEKEGGLIYIPEDDRNKNRNLVSFDFNYAHCYYYGIICTMICIHETLVIPGLFAKGIQLWSVTTMKRNSRMEMYENKIE